MLQLIFNYLSKSWWKHIQMTIPSVVFVLGGPGAGKGTQCSKIVEKYGYVHLSAGDLLRAERNKSDSEVGQLIADYIKNGQIVPVKITCGLLSKAMTETLTASEGTKNKFLIDGFPRNHDNLVGWNKEMDGKANLQFVLFFKCSESICISRILDRAKTSGRTDDNMESLKKRFETYVRETEPVISHYSSLNKVRTVNAKESEDKVFTEVCKIFDGTSTES